MKIILKPFILICLFSLLTQLLPAQETYKSYKGNFNFGFDGGIQFTNADDHSTNNPASRKTGYSFGPYAEYFISDLFTVRLGLYLDNRGFNIDDLYVGYGDTSQLIPDSVVFSWRSYLHVTRDYNVNYLTIPLSINYIKGSDKFKIFVQVGVYYSILLNASQSGYNDLYIDPDYAPHFSPPFNVPGHQIENFDGDVTSLFNSYDFGMCLYLGGIFNFNEHWGITVSPGFMYSFTSLYANPEKEAKWTQIFKINAGVVYTFIKK